MADVYGHASVEEFLELEPDEVAAAILPRIRQMASQTGQVNDWNVRLGAKNAHGREVAVAVAEGWQWLLTEGYLAASPDNSGDWYVLTRRGRQADLKAHVADARAIGLLRSAMLDTDLSADVMPSFRRGQYDLAVLAAMREVEDRVRHVSKLKGKYGTDLMRAAFGPSGPLEDQALDPGERKARADLFAGAVGVHRNPSGHQAVDYSDAQEAAEAILFANNLLRHIKRAAVATRGRGRPAARKKRNP